MSFSIVLHYCADSCIMAFLHFGQHGVGAGAKRPALAPYGGTLKSTCVGQTWG